MVQFLARGILRLAVGALPDGILRSEPATVVASGFLPPNHLCRFVGFLTSGKKDRPPSNWALLVGSEISIGSRTIRASARADRAREIRVKIAQELQRNQLPPSDARKLRGELGFYTALLAGEIGRGMMGPLSYGSKADEVPDSLPKCGVIYSGGTVRLFGYPPCGQLSSLPSFRGSHGRTGLGTYSGCVRIPVSCNNSHTPPGVVSRPCFPVGGGLRSFCAKFPRQLHVVHFD